MKTNKFKFKSDNKGLNLNNKSKLSKYDEYLKYY